MPDEYELVFPPGIAQDLVSVRKAIQRDIDFFSSFTDVVPTAWGTTIDRSKIEVDMLEMDLRRVNRMLTQYDRGFILVDGQPTRRN